MWPGRKGWPRSPVAAFPSHELGAYWEALIGAGEGCSLPLISWGSSCLCYAISIFASTWNWFLLSLESVFLALSLKVLGQISCCCEYAKFPHSDQEQKGAISFIVHTLCTDRQWANYWNSHYLQDI